MKRERLTQVLLVDDDPVMLKLVTVTLEGKYDIVGSTENGPDLLTEAAKSDPDVIVLDINLPGMDGFEIARQLVQAGSRAKRIFLSSHEEALYVEEAFEVGAQGYVVKTCCSQDLASAIEAVLLGQRFISSKVHLGLPAAVISRANLAAPIHAAA